MRRMTVLLMRLAGMTMTEALDLTWDEAGLWLESALEVEKELRV